MERETGVSCVCERKVFLIFVVGRFVTFLEGVRRKTVSCVGMDFVLMSSIIFSVRFSAGRRRYEREEAPAGKWLDLYDRPCERSHLMAACMTR